ncbi:sensor histidine kinase [Gulosibacter chungangensis]|nr:ATP-binding protein [Gulosibacter chungangensis]
MAATHTRRSAASGVFLIIVIAVFLLSAALFALLVSMGRLHASEKAEDVTEAVSVTLADLELVQDAMLSDNPTAILQPVTQQIVDHSDVDFITIMTPEGVRVTHPIPEEIGQQYTGVIPEEPTIAVGTFMGQLGESLRTIVPIQVDGEVVGWVATGQTLVTISEEALKQLPISIVAFVVLLAFGILVAVLARRMIWKLAGDLPASEIRSTITARESIRTLSDALRSQTHEYRNRMHTAVGLLELERSSEAVQLLTQTEQQSQFLLDFVDAHDRLDPAIISLLLGKASQAKERGIEWSMEVAPDTPRSVLGAVDCVAVVGNILDNAMDAAMDSATSTVANDTAATGTVTTGAAVTDTVATGTEAPWVEVSLHASVSGDLEIVVMDSGDGIPEDLRERVLDPGFSTKPAGSAGRGVGLALVTQVLAGVGGELELATELPMTVTVRIPAARAPGPGTTGIGTSSIATSNVANSGTGTSTAASSETGDAS